jgi:hypothetical protein
MSPGRTRVKKNSVYTVLAFRSGFPLASTYRDPTAVVTWFGIIRPEQGRSEQRGRNCTRSLHSYHFTLKVLTSPRSMLNKDHKRVASDVVETQVDQQRRVV